MKQFLKNICASILVLVLLSQYQVPWMSVIPKVEAEFISSSNTHVTLPFISKEQVSKDDFHSLVVAWEGASSAFHMEIRTQNRDGQWTDWKEILLDADGQDVEEDPKRFSSMLSFEPTKIFQYKIDSSVLGQTIDFDYLDFLVFRQRNDISLDIKLPSAEAKTDGLIVTREEWGADPAWIEKETWTKERDTVCKAKPWYCGSSAAGEKAIEDKAKKLAEDYPDDTKIDSLRTSLNGKDVQWPIQTSAKIKKIFIHHTAELSSDLNKDGVIDQEDEKMVMRNDYYFHSLVRGWGDIGYNYVVGSTGTIYEGRAGGDRVVAAHAVWRNISSIGISTMGNFEEENMQTPQYTGLANAIGYVAKKYSLDPLGDSLFYGQTASTVLGHRDSEEAATACPGKNLYAKLPDLRKLAALAKDQLLTVDSVAAGGFTPADITKNGISGSFIPLPNMITFGPVETKSIAIQVKNTGTTAWNKTSYLRITSSIDGVFTIQSGDKMSNKAAYLTESSVAPGGVGTFVLNITSQYKKYADSLNFDAVINGAYLLKASFIQVSSADAVLGFEMQSIVQPKKELIYGEETKLLVLLKNTSNASWNTSAIHLSNINSTYQELMPNGDGVMREALVKPNETATFEVAIRAPIKSTSYELQLLPIIANAPAFIGNPVKVTGTVVHPALSKNFSLEQVSTTPSNIRMGNTGMISLTLKNTSLEPWTGLSKYDLKANFLSNTPFVIPVTSLRFDRDYVNTGESITVQVPLQAGYNAMGTPPLFQLKYLDLPLTKSPLTLPFTIPEETLSAQYAASGNMLSMSLNTKSPAQLMVQNTGTLPWKKGQVQLAISTDSSAMQDTSWINKNIIANFEGNMDIEPQQFALFKFTTLPTKVQLTPTFVLQVVNGPLINITGTTPAVTVKTTANQTGGAIDFGTSLTRLIPTVKLFESGTLASIASNNSSTFSQPVRVKLSYAETNATLVLKDSSYRMVLSDNPTGVLLSANTELSLETSGSNITIKIKDKKYQSSSISLIPIDPEGKFSITNWVRGTDKSTMYDTIFRTQLDVKKDGDSLMYVNTLSLEDYLRGVAELPSTDPIEKQKALSIVARSYALYYQNPINRRVNQSSFYDMTDNPNEYQRYRGYAFETRNSTWLSALESTANKILTFDNHLIKPPFFSESDGRTRSAYEVWKWTETPYLLSVDDKWCKEGKGQLKGHGVGLSGCGAYGMALAGKNYEEIISYYYQGIHISDTSQNSF